MDEPVAVVHIVNESTTPGQRETIAALVAASNQIGRQRVMQPSRGAAWLVEPAPGFAEILNQPAPVAHVASAHTVVHFWSPPSSRIVAALRDSAGGPYLLDWDATHPPATLPAVDFAGVTVDSQRAAAVLARLGVDRARSAVIRPSVDFSLLRGDRRAEIRRQLGLQDGPAVLIAQPMSRRMNPYYAAWACLLVERAYPGLQIIVSGFGEELRRIERLCAMVQRDARLRTADEAQPLADLLLAADLAVVTPNGLGPLRPVAWALAAGCPLVASATHANCEVLAHGVNARLARDTSPRLIARRILETLEAADGSRDQISHGRSQAYALFSRQRMIGQYRQAYHNARAGRPLSDGIEDPLSASSTL